MHTTAPNTPAQDTHHISYFLADSETPNRHYTTERLLRKRNHKDYINKWKEQIKESYKIASKQGKKKDIQHREIILQGFH